MLFPTLLLLLNNLKVDLLIICVAKVFNESANGVSRGGLEGETTLERTLSHPRRRRKRGSVQADFASVTLKSCRGAYHLLIRP